MAKLADLVPKIRSKNAGPFWVTVDIFCGDAARFAEIRARLTTAHVCARLRADPAMVKRFDIESLAVIKFSFIRPAVQGSRFDRDMHGAQLGVLFAELEI
jgi:hypothetical protein